MLIVIHCFCRRQKYVEIVKVLGELSTHQRSLLIQAVNTSTESPNKSLKKLE